VQKSGGDAARASGADHVATLPESSAPARDAGYVTVYAGGMKFQSSFAVCSFFACAVACGGTKPEAEAPAAPTPVTATTAPGDAGAPPAAPAPAAAAANPEPTTLVVDFVPKSGSKLAGKATLTESGTGVKIVLEIEGITPGDHGAHVHETPDCSAPDAKTAGSHYNPDKHDHGMPDAKQRHLGDLGNIVAGKDGKAKLEIVVPDANLKPNDPHSFLGRAIIVHEKKDDGGQPVGNAGGRIGCAAIVAKS
jgi:Cu-Zn family superoxide dismutase